MSAISTTSPLHPARHGCDLAHGPPPVTLECRVDHEVDRRRDGGYDEPRRDVLTREQGKGHISSPPRGRCWHGWCTSRGDPVSARPPADSRDHRAGSHADLKKLRPGAPALREVHRQRSLAGAGRHRVQPHAHRRHDRRPRPGEGDHRHHPPQADQRPGPGGDLSTTGHPAPTDRLSLGNREDPPVHPRLRATDTSDDLTTQPSRRDRTTTWNTPTARSENRAALRPLPRRLEEIGPRTQAFGGSRLRRGRQLCLGARLPRRHRPPRTASNGKGASETPSTGTPP